MPRLVLSAVLVGTTLLAGCSVEDSPGGRSEAEELAATFFTRVSSGEPDYGWSLIAGADEVWGSYERYEGVVIGQDWSRFEVEVIGTVRCQDGTTCSVCLRIPGGPESVPKFLLASSPRLYDGINFEISCSMSQGGDAIVGVVLSPFPWGDRGVVMPPRQ